MRINGKYYHDAQFFDDETNTGTCFYCGCTLSRHHEGHCPAGDDPAFLRDIGQPEDAAQAEAEQPGILASIARRFARSAGTTGTT